MTGRAEGRGRELERRFGGAVPELWCPPLTHYRDDGAIDAERIRCHWRYLRRHVAGFLVPGSTGDGWELSRGEAAELLDLALDLAAELDAHLLVGVLEPDARATRRAIRGLLARLGERTGCADPGGALARARVRAVTVCAPRGEGRSQEEIGRELAAVLELGLPTALYQLPQVTGNEVSPETFARLAERFDNLILFKDSSGTDRVARADAGRSGVFLVRGAEGEYMRWSRRAGGPYHGFLLSTANGLGAELAEMLQSLEAGDEARAAALSRRLAEVADGAFRAVAAVEWGNPFANANKAIDHWMAHGSGAGDVAPPRLHAGPRLPAAAVREVGQLLAAHGLLPARGYREAGAAGP